ncbi:hypothetical protein CMT41_00930 [Colwellia sp. MT41]|uniref:DUF4340 domain-containing protein n=1 Tax=Colwellia marinimaniae TaxID=1513592 RepID=A0ABQ0MRR7_9GAMM|nr:MULTISPECIES: hypothetical protein [Colwellia]ALO33436.1 hypothetical protein CMT41_00930 [Colwellia sp. MT41]GAW95057.1 hypothetical protein MTCD1_00656 [Colwellia marinimaniae]
MKLSRTGWNNVIIFSVMTIILVINATNNKLFPKEEHENTAEQLILPQHSVILTLAIDLSARQQVLFERVGRSWQLTAKGIMLVKTEQQIEQMMFAWQQSTGLVQAAEIVIDSEQAINVEISLAGESQARTFMLYPLNDQLLIYQQQGNTWLALPPALAQQLLPISL